MKLADKQRFDLDTTLESYPLVRSIAQAIVQQGGRAILVGGAVRDLLLALPIKDLDIEVHGLALEQLEQVLKQFGPVSLVGKAFGVLRVHGLDVDWSLPRADASGRKPEVTIDPNMSYEHAFARRDLTINAMGIDLLSHELIDPFNGQQDLKNKVLRAPDSALFVEDPLRFYRVMQFIGRFGMQPDETLNKLCKTMDLRGVSRERIEVEFEKLLLKSKQPSLGIRWINSIGRLQELLPELGALVGVEQEFKWHPEGDVFEHSMQALDAAAQLQYDNDKQKLTVLYAALCHDLGKATTTKIIDGVIKSLEHANVGAKISRTFLKRITNNSDLLDAVCKLVKYHMVPTQFIAVHAKAPPYKRLANKLAPHATLQMLGLVAYADKRGRNPQGHTPLVFSDSDHEIDLFLQNAQELRVHLRPEEPLLLGRDIMDIVQPGPRMGQFLKKAYEIQIEEGIQDTEELKRRAFEAIKAKK